jgi:hypothetical protein
MHARTTHRESPPAFACEIQALLPVSAHSNGAKRGKGEKQEKKQESKAYAYKDKRATCSYISGVAKSKEGRPKSEKDMSREGRSEWEEMKRSCC